MEANRNELGLHLQLDLVLLQGPKVWWVYDENSAFKKQFANGSIESSGVGPKVAAQGFPPSFEGL